MLARYAVVMSPSITSRYSVKTDKQRIMQKRHTIAQVVWFSDAEDIREIPPGITPSEGAKCRWGSLPSNSII